MIGSALQRRFNELKQKAITHIANRSFKRNPNWLDRLAIRVIEAGSEPVSSDPEMEVPAFKAPKPGRRR